VNKTLTIRNGTRQLAFAHPREYNSFRAMRDRCYRENNAMYYLYGGRGITVCDRWRYDFPQFFVDMGERPEGLTLERVDNEAGYNPENCIWATTTKQMVNRRNTVLITYEGKTRTLKAWGVRFGVNYHTLHTRLRLHNMQPPELFEPAFESKHFIEFNGECRTLAEWSRHFDIKYRTLHRRLAVFKLTPPELFKPI